MIKFFFTKDKKWLDKWDQYVVDNPQGSHLILSDWLQSYNSYGFNYEVGIILEDNNIVGGFGAILPKFLFFKFYIIPHGPIYSLGYENFLLDFLKMSESHAKKLGCCYLQFSLPISSNKKILEFSQGNVKVNLDGLFKSGKFFKHVYSAYGLNWVDFREFKHTEDFLKQLTPKVRRNIRMPYNKSAKPVFVTDEISIRKGYELIIENAKYGHYSVRSFDEFKQTILTLINKGKACFVVCEVEGVPKAAALFIDAGDYYTNIMGGVLREKPDIKLGYMLQWEIIKKSFEKGYKGYNISMGGSPGVQDFKSKFGAETIYYERPHYHKVISPLYFKLFRFADTYLKSYKTQISKILSYLK